MPKPYPPIRALVLRALDGGQKTANQLRAELTPDAENCMSIVRTLNVLVLSGLVRIITIHRSRATDPQHAYALAIPLQQALPADRANFERMAVEGKAKRRKAAPAKAAKPKKKEKAEPARVLSDIPAGAIMSRVAGGGDCYTLGNRRIFKLEGAKRKLATDCIGNKITGGTGISSCAVEFFGVV